MIRLPVKTARRNNFTPGPKGPRVENCITSLSPLTSPGQPGRCSQVALPDLNWSVKPRASLLSISEEIESWKHLKNLPLKFLAICPDFGRLQSSPPLTNTADFRNVQTAQHKIPPWSVAGQMQAPQPSKWGKIHHSSDLFGSSFCWFAS